MFLNIMSSSMFLTICFLLTVKWFWSRRKFYKLAWKCNGPYSWPIIGSALSVRGSPEDITNYFAKMYKEYNTPIFDWFGTYPVYYVKEPEEVGVMFNSPHLIKKAVLYKAMNWCFGDSILTTFQVNRWKVHRKALTSSFNTVMLDAYGVVFQKRTIQLVEDLKKYAGKGEFNIVQEMEKYSLGNLTETALGRILDEKVQDDKNYLINLEKMKDYVSDITVSLFFYIKYLDKIVFKTILGKEGMILVDEIYGFVSKIMNERRKVRQEAEKQANKEEELSSKNRLLIDKLLDLTGEDLPFNDREAFDQILIFIAAGSDTCAYTYANICLMLGMNPEQQEIAYREVIDLVGNSNRPITKEDIQHLPYIERFVKETLRLFPVANAVGRESTDEVDLGSTTLPKGINVVLNLIEYHRDPRFWNNPLKFDPDRFLPEEVSKRPPNTYLPFTTGARNCIGFKYGMIVLVMTTASLVRAYKFSSRFKDISELKYGMAVVTRLINGHLVKIEDRRNQ